MRVTTKLTGVQRSARGDQYGCTSSLTQVSPGRRKDPDPQQPGIAKRTSGRQDGHLTRTAKWTDATPTVQQKKDK
ncbi:hypothetical protein ElyMa_007013600 [Elysia marginata]|uniref:Uncharacterized protein n=1 Tax=Elysia marginata TaxID=1093978 RepID=A0AAV4JSA5_9GAST|nr:hypothetical protein ElyMa_007013600 [Elysia marginata]